MRFQAPLEEGLITVTHGDMDQVDAGGNTAAESGGFFKSTGYAGMAAGEQQDCRNRDQQSHVQIIDTEELSCHLLEYLRDNYPKSLEERYKMMEIADMQGYELLEYLGKKRGFVISGGEIDTERAAGILLDEFRGAKLGNITLEKPSDF